MNKHIYKPVKCIWIAAALCFLLTASAVVCGSVYGYALLHAALDGRRERPEAVTHLSEFALREQMHISHSSSQVNGWLSFINSQDVSLRTGQIKRYAKVYDAVRGGSHAPWALVLHGGVGTDHTQVLDVACEFSLSGYRVLTPDLSAHGQSEGEMTSLGLREHEDVSAWIAWIKQQDPLARIVIWGHDEGAVAALLESASDMDESVCAVIADSPYLRIDERLVQMLEESAEKTSVLEQFLVKLAYRIVFGESNSADMRQALSQCRIPVLLIYGSGDEDTPAWYGEELLASAGENVRLLLIEGAVHGMARYEDPKAYYNAILTHCDTACMIREAE